MRSRTIRALAVSVIGLVAGCGGGGGGSSGGGSTANSVIMNPPNQTVLPNATIGQVYSQTFTVQSGGTAPYILSPTGLPNGLAWSSNSTSGTLSGTPSQIGQGTFEINITDATGLQASVGYTLTVQQAGVLTLSPSTAPGGSRGSPYNVQIGIVGGTPPYNFTSTGNLPPGITLGPSTQGAQAQLAGTPVASGTYTFTVKATDASSPQQSGSVQYSIVIP
jgi:hypothetical protein